MLGTEQQDLRREGALITNTPFREPGRGAPAARCRNRWTDRHRAGRLLQATFGAYRQGQSGDGYGAQDRSPVLQRRASRNGVRRPGCVVLRDTLPHAGDRQSAPARQGVRICSPAHGARRRFLGTFSSVRSPIFACSPFTSTAGSLVLLLPTAPNTSVAAS